MHVCAAAAASNVAEAAIEVESVTVKPKPEPGYQMEAIDELFDHTKPSSSSAGRDAADAPGGAQQWGTLADAAASEQQEDKVDSWGTTRESPAEIARRIVQSNLEADAAEADAAEAHDLAEDSDDELRLAPGEEKYKTLEQMSADIKGLDEVSSSVGMVDLVHVMFPALQCRCFCHMLGLTFHTSSPTWTCWMLMAHACMFHAPVKCQVIRSGLQCVILQSLLARYGPTL